MLQYTDYDKSNSELYLFVQQVFKVQYILFEKLLLCGWGVVPLGRGGAGRLSYLK